MKTLYFLRHAHAEARALSLSDYDRPLDEAGQNQAKAIADYIAKKGISFDFVMCSSALRTQETLESLRQVLGTEAIEISQDFYNISENEILTHLRRVSNEREQILYIGHNPGIAFAILKFAKVFPGFLREGVTPGMLVGLHFSGEKWASLDWHEAEIIDIFEPSLSLGESPALVES